jgi:acetyl-CoA carboxylase carboxyltransferase component
MFANLGRVPVVALALGPVAGLGAAKIAASHYSAMVRGTAQVFVAGPPVVARAGEQVDKETLGGAAVHGQNGVVDEVVESEAEAFARSRRFLSYLPPSVFDLPPRGPRDPDDRPDRREDWLIGAIPRNRRAGFKIRPIVEAVVDRGSFFEIGRGWGRPVVTGLARLDGWPVAVMANDPYISGGGWTAAGSEKVVRFVDLADTFHLPMVHLVDQPGFTVGTASEREGAIRAGTRAMAAVYQAGIPWCTVLLRRAYGVAGAAAQNHARFAVRFAWPSGDWGSLPIEGGVEAAFRAEIEAAPDPAARVAEIEQAFNLMRSPFRTAEAFGVEDIVDPRETRPLLCEFAELAAPVRRPGPTARPFRP